MGKRCECGHERYKLVIRDRVLCWDTARKSEHLYKHKQAWSLQAEIIQHHQRAGDVDVVRIVDTETGATYTASLSQIATYGKGINFPNYGAQIALPLKFWTCDNAPTRTVSAHQTTVRQLELFELAARPG